MINLQRHEGKLYVTAASMHQHLTPDLPEKAWVTQTTTSSNARAGKEFLRINGAVLFSIPFAQHICLSSMSLLAMPLFDHLDKVYHGHATSSAVIASAEAKLRSKEEEREKAPVRMEGRAPRRSYKRKEDRLLARVRAAVTTAVTRSGHTSSSAWGVVREVVNSHGVSYADESMISAVRSSGKGKDIVLAIEAELIPPAGRGAAAAAAN